MAKSKLPPEPVGAEELKDAILRMIVEKFDGRPLDWQTAERALALAAFEIKQAALFAPSFRERLAAREWKPKPERQAVQPSRLMAADAPRAR